MSLKKITPNSLSLFVLDKMFPTVEYPPYFSHYSMFILVFSQDTDNFIFN